MKVGLNVRILRTETLRGWSRYTVNLLAELSSLGLELCLYSDAPLHDAHLSRLAPGRFQVRIAPRMHYLEWEQQWLPRQAAADNVAVLHTPFNFGLPWRSPCAQVLTLHDAIGQYDRPLKERIKLESLKMGVYHWVSRTRADRIVTVSNHSKRDLVQQLGVHPGKIDVVYEAADSRFHENISASDRALARQRHHLTEPYIFYVGGWEERKNVPFLLRAFAAARTRDVQLVLAGGLESQRGEMLALAHALGVADSVRLLGWVDDAELPALYADASCFVYPSTYEGFGLQLCEAMAVGCPTLAAQATCLPEVLGYGGETFSLHDVSQLVALLSNVVESPSYRADLRDRAVRRAADFSWRRTAEETVVTYEAAISSHFS